MLHSRINSPKNKKVENKKVEDINFNFNRSKSSFSLAQMSSQVEKNFSNRSIKQAFRIQSALKRKEEQPPNKALPKVSNHILKGKLHLGKIVKPQIILKNEARHNPWRLPSPINQQLINKKGLMEIINMGILPKNANFSELLNNRYEQKKQQNNGKGEQEGDFFATNPQVVKQNEIVEKVEGEQKDKEKQNKSKKKDKKSKKKNKKPEKNYEQQIIQNLMKQPVILQIKDSKLFEDEAYAEQLKKHRRNGDLAAFNMFLKKVVEFSIKYGLKKFQFYLTLNQTKKITQESIKNSILNAKQIGVNFAMNGSLKSRIYDVAQMFAMRFKFKKSKRDLLKIENIKKFFKIKKYYEQMTKRRCDFLKFKLGSFAERQRRFLQQSLQGGITQDKFRIEFHLLTPQTISFQEQLSFYKLKQRENIQLTRIFSQDPENLFLVLCQEQFSLDPWIKLLRKIRGYHPVVTPIFLYTRNLNVRSIDSTYYAINFETMKRIKSICGKIENICLLPSCYNLTVVKICEIFNSKLFSGNFWKPHLQKLLQEQQEEQSAMGKDKVDEIVKIMNIQHQKIENTYRSSPSSLLSNSQLNDQRLTERSRIYTEAQIKHFIQKMKTKELNKFELTAEHYSNKLLLKKDIILQLGLQTPLSITFEPNVDERQFFFKLTELIVINKNINKWVFKIGGMARFSRQIAFLQTDSLKILKEKKKKSQTTEADIVEVANIMKVILVDKLQLPQNSLLDSTQFIQRIVKLGGYVESVVPETTTECVFGRITSTGNLDVQGTYTKLYTDQSINFGASYPSNTVTDIQINEIRQISQKLFTNFGIFGPITVQLLFEKRSKKHYYIDLVFHLDQYSSLYYMYSALFSNVKQYSQSLSILQKLNRRQITVSSGNSHTNLKKTQKSQKSLNKLSEAQKKTDKLLPQMMRNVVYIPFIDNNGNLYKNFGDFEDALEKNKLKLLDFDDAQGLQFLYLNLKEQLPDVLSLVCFSSSQRKSLKYTLQGLNFLVDNSESANKFDKKVERRKYDCLYLNDIIWKLREIKKSKDSNQKQQKQKQKQKIDE